jgi:hypothetical protein
MPTLVRLIAKYAPYLYVVCALILLPFLREVRKARLDRQSIFPLEKESAAKRSRRATFGIVLLLAIAAGIFYISSYVRPTIVELDGTPTPTSTTSLLLNTPTGPPPPPTETPTITPTATRRPRPTPQQIAPTDTPASSVIAPNCPTPGVQLSFPGTNTVLKGTVEIRGSASIENFGYYKFEFKSLATTDEWHHVYTNQQPVPNGVLGYWNVDPLPAGPYLFQLVVVDITGNYPPPCQVTISIEH